MTNAKTQTRDFTTGFNRIMYGLMLLLSLYYLVFSKDIAAAMSTLGIGLIFDPFKPETSWRQRPFYQKSLLLIHLSGIFILLGILGFNYFTR